MQGWQGACVPKMFAATQNCRLAQSELTRSICLGFAGMYFCDIGGKQTEKSISDTAAMKQAAALEADKIVNEKKEDAAALKQAAAMEADKIINDKRW